MWLCEINKAVEHIFIFDVLMLCLHVPSAIGTLARSSFHLNQTRSVAIKVINKDVGFTSSSWGLSSKYSSSQQAREN
jgi:hypothetical protein